MSQNDLEQRIARLEDESAIRTLIYEYCYTQDQRKVEPFLDLMTDDIHFTFPGWQLELNGKEELKPVDVDLRKLLENSLIMIKEKAMKRRIQLSKKIEEIPDTVKVDERKLKQIMYNLLSNAVKFTPDGGEIQLAAELAENSWLRTLDKSRSFQLPTFIGVAVPYSDYYLPPISHNIMLSSTLL